MKTGSPSVPSSRRRHQLRARKLTIDKFAAWQKSQPRHLDAARPPVEHSRTRFNSQR